MTITFVRVNIRHISDEMINAIDILYMHQQKKENLKNSHNPVSELITPEWHYSDSFRVFDSIQISWNNLEKEASLIQSIAEKIDKIRISDNVVGVGEFEKSFCSWYQPYHYLPREKWGIHIRYDSWIGIAAVFYRNCNSSLLLAHTSLDFVKSAFLYLFVHELFHYIVENAASIVEIVSGKPHIYTKYYNDVYSNVFNSSNCIEEALSNRYLFGWAEECHIKGDFLKKELLNQGPGYNNFIQYVDSNFFKGNRILVSQIRYGSLNPPLHDPLEQIIDISNPIEYCSVHNVPIWLHRRPKPVYEKHF